MIAYKVLRIRDGKYCSSDVYNTPLGLIYTENRWIASRKIALAEGCGIYCFHSLDIAKKWASIATDLEVWKIEGDGELPPAMKNPGMFSQLANIKEFAEYHCFTEYRLMLEPMFADDIVSFRRIRLIQKVAGWF